MKASVRLVRFATIGTLNYLITMLVIWIVMSYFSFKGNIIVANIMHISSLKPIILYGANIGFFLPAIPKTVFGNK
mgnify:CR=1 FL=1